MTGSDSAVHYGKKLTELGRLSNPTLETEMFAVLGGNSGRITLGGLLALPLFRAAHIYVSRDDAQAGVSLLTPNVRAIFVMESGRLVVRERDMTGEDPLTSGWGVSFRSASSLETAQANETADEANTKSDFAVQQLGFKVNRVDGVNFVPTDTAVFSVDSNDGEARVFEINNQGRTRIGDLQADRFATEFGAFSAIDVGEASVAPSADGWVFTIPDEEGNIGAGLRSDGVWCVKELATTEPLPNSGLPPAAVFIENRPEDSLRGIMHRGYSAIAPENTLPAYRECARVGRYVVEGDIQWTSDNVAVLLHDPTVDRTSNGTGAIASMTFDQARALDFNNDMSGYSGVQIPTFREFMLLCKRLSLFAYCELKSSNWTDAQVAEVLRIIKETGMKGRVELDSFTQASLEKVRTQDPTQAIGRLGTMSADLVAACVALQTGQNVVAAVGAHGSITQELVVQANAAGVPVVVWTVDAVADVQRLAPLGVSGIMTNTLNINETIRKSEGL